MIVNEFFKSVIDQDDKPIVICDLNSTIIYMNPSSLLRYKGDLTGKNLKDCHNAESNKIIDRVIEWFKESVENNIVYTSRIERENSDIYMVALRDKNGTLIGYYEKHESRSRDTDKFLNI